MTTSDWQQKAQAKQASAAAKIPAEWQLSPDILGQVSQDAPKDVLHIPGDCGILSEKELQITENFDATALLEKLASREFSALEVTRAFCKRAAIAQQLTCCLTETFFDIALARAKELDERLAATGGKPVGPLHGLPISIKDSFDVTGVASSLGLVSFLDRGPKSSNSGLVDILLRAGAILYVKTNVPQTLMTADSHNNVFGRVLNPFRLNLTAGGSSGGEGALVALRGSVLGVGTDIAGSIRIPALCCGTFGFKPSVGRVPYGGQTSPARAGLTGIAAVAGPLCHSVRDAELFLRVVFQSSPDDLDDGVLGTPWIEPPRQQVLTVGVMPEDPAYPLHPPMKRTLDIAAKKLAAAGHHLVDLSGGLPSLSGAHDLSFRYFNMDPDRTQLGNVTRSGEPPVPSLKFTYNVDGTGPEPTLRELYDMNVARAGVIAHMRQAFVENKLDLVLGPAYQSCAVAHDDYGSPVYTVISNCVDQPSCVIPFGKANEAADAEWARDVRYVPQYQPNEVEGTPCHVQLIGRRFKDEALVHHAEVVESVLNK